MSKIVSGSRRGAVVAVAVVLALLCSVPIGSHDPVASVSWDRDVEPILKTRCYSCHLPEGPALPTLGSFEDAKIHRVAIKMAVLGRRMPVWSAVRGFGSFHRDASLSPVQISLIASWIEAGAPAPVGTGAPTPERENLAKPGSARPRRIVTVDLPPLTSPDGVQRDRATIAGTGRLTVVGWRFVAGDPTIRSVKVADRFGRRLWTALPGFDQESFPVGTGIVLESPFELMVESSRRTRDADGSIRPPKKNVSQFEIELSPTPLASKLETVRADCAAHTRIQGTIYALQPDPSIAGPVEVRVGSRTPRVLGLFRQPEPTYPIRYWLREPTVMGEDSVLEVLGQKCSVEVTVAVPDLRVRSSAR